MKPLGLLAIVFGAVLIGMAMVFGAPAYLDEPVRVMLGLGFAGAFTIVLRGPIGAAIAHQIKGGSVAPGSDFEGRLLTQMDDLTAELQAMREEMMQLNERMDFTERLLTRQQEAARLGAGTEPGRGA